MNEKTDIKKITATFIGDEAVELELIEKSLRLDKVAKTKSERDMIFFKLALNALKKSISEYSVQKSVKYPSFEDIKQFLE